MIFIKLRSLPLTQNPVKEIEGFDWGLFRLGISDCFDFGFGIADCGLWSFGSWIGEGNQMYKMVDGERLNKDYILFCVLDVSRTPYALCGWP